MNKIVHNVEKNEISEIALSDDELDLAVKESDLAAKQEALLQTKLAEKANLKKVLLDKLGITEEEARLLLGGN